MALNNLNIALNRIKDKISLSTIIAKDIPLQKKGREFVGNCPFHNEKTGSFFVNDDKGTFYCFGCGATGDLFEYYMRKNGVNFNQALERLAEIAGVQLPEKNDTNSVKLKTQQNILKKISDFFREQLKESAEALDYCKARKLSNNLMETFEIGYAGAFYDKKILNILKNEGFNQTDIITSGIFIKKDTGELTSRFKNRLMFPVFNKQGWPIALAGRTLKNLNPKYINSPETDLFQKKETLYGYNIASKNVSKTKPLIVVEGYLDVIILNDYGFKTAVATMGTSFSTDHLLKIWKYCDEPIICLDGDKAGYKAMIKISILALNHIQPGKSLRFLIIPNEDDPDSFLQNHGAEIFDTLIKSSMSLIDFLWFWNYEEYEAINEKTPEKAALWKNNLLTLLESIKNTDIKNLYKNQINEKIFETLRGKKEKSSNFSKKFDVFIDKKEKIFLRETLLLYTILEKPNVLLDVIEHLIDVEFSKDEYIVIKDIMLEENDTRLVFEKYNPVCLEISTLGAKYCNVKAMDNEEALHFWKEVYNFEFSKKNQKKDILTAKKECVDGLTHSNWERLKALKIDAIKNKI